MADCFTSPRQWLFSEQARVQRCHMSEIWLEHSKHASFLWMWSEVQHRSHPHLQEGWICGHETQQPET